MATYAPPSASIRVLTEKDGLLSAVAHDLELEVTDFTVSADDRAVSATVWPGSLRVLHALKNGRPTTALSDKDKADIQTNLARHVLDPARTITFVSSSVVKDGGGGLRVGGTLTLNGVARVLSCQARVQGDRLVAELPLHQPDFGIRPFSAMMGTMKVKPTVVVRVDLPRW
jgi:YceI-like domain